MTNHKNGKRYNDDFRKMDEMIKNEQVLSQDSARGIGENERYCVKAVSLF